jgi:hypothetical protein
MMDVAQWLAQHPQFGGQQHITDPAPQALANANPNAAFQGGNPGMTAHGFFGNIGGLLSGGPMPGLQAWRARREAAGLPFRSHHMHQMQAMGMPPQAQQSMLPAMPTAPAQQAQPNTMFNAPGGGSSYVGQQSY